MRFSSIFACALVLGATVSSVNASDLAVKAPEAAGSLVPDSAFFLGAGGSYGAVQFKDESIYATGDSIVYQNGVQVAQGTATGGMSVDMASDSTFAPVIQLGYFKHFENSDWLWGAKFAYSYFDGSSHANHLLVPQDGGFTSNSPSTFEGRLLVREYKTSMDHQFSLIPFIGKSFEKGFIYAGAGPTLSRVKNEMNGVIGFADINGTHTDITGQATDFSTTQWAWGGAGTIGATYFIDASLFIDLNYTFAMSQRVTDTFFAPFDNPSRDGHDYTGVGYGNYSSRVVTQAVAISLNRAF